MFSLDWISRFGASHGSVQRGTQPGLAKRLIYKRLVQEVDQADRVDSGGNRQADLEQVFARLQIQDRLGRIGGFEVVGELLHFQLHVFRPVLERHERLRFGGLLADWLENRTANAIDFDKVQ